MSGSQSPTATPATPATPATTRAKVEEYVASAVDDLVQAKADYAKAQLEAWGLCSQLAVWLMPDSPDSDADQRVVSDDQIRQVTIVLDHLRDRGRQVTCCQEWLRDCERLAAHIDEKEARRRAKQEAKEGAAA